MERPRREIVPRLDSDGRIAIRPPIAAQHAPHARPQDVLDQAAERDGKSFHAASISARARDRQDEPAGAFNALPVDTTDPNQTFHQFAGGIRLAANRDTFNRQTMRSLRVTNTAIYNTGMKAGKKWAGTATEQEIANLRTFAEQQDAQANEPGIPIEDAYSLAEHIAFAIDGTDEPGNRDRDQAQSFWDSVGHDDDARDDDDFLNGFVEGAISD
jgi:hypothetical protein